MAIKLTAPEGMTHAEIIGIYLTLKASKYQPQQECFVRYDVGTMDRGKFDPTYTPEGVPLTGAEYAAILADKRTVDFIACVEEVLAGSKVKGTKESL